MADASRALINQMTAEIHPRLEDWFGSGAQLAAPVPDLDMLNWSFILRYRVNRPNGTTVGLLVKVPRLKAMTTLAQAAGAADLVPLTRTEYNALVTIWETNQRGAPEFCAIRPLAFLDGWNAIVMEELALEPIKRLLFQPGMFAGRESNWREFRSVLFQAGRWLKRFHNSVGQLQIERLDSSHLRADARAGLQDLETASQGRVDVQDFEPGLNRLVAQLQNVPVPVAYLHKDFTCANVFTVGHGQVGVLDPEAYVRGPVYADIAILINDLHTRGLQVLSQGKTWPHKRLEECAAAVLDGYFQDRPYRRDILDLYCAFALIRKWILIEQMMHEARGMRRLVQWFAPLVRRYMRSKLQCHIDVTSSSRCTERRNVNDRETGYT